MKKRKLVLFLVLLFATFRLFAQEADEIDPMPIKLKGQVLNIENEMPVPYAYILNFRNHTSVTANDQGFFTMEMLNIDSLEISSMGFIKMTVRVPANYNEMNVVVFYVRPVIFSLPQVNVKGAMPQVNMDGVPKGKKSTIDPQLRGDAYDKKPPVLAALFNPASFLQYYTSKREREKRATREAIVNEKKWESLSQYYRKELVMELTGMNESQADSFMVYFNSTGILSQLSTEYDVRNAIGEVYKIYREKGH